MKEKYIVVVAGSCIDTYYDVESFLGAADAGYAYPAGDKIGGCVLNVGAIAASLGTDVKALDYLRENDEGTDMLLDGMKAAGMDTSYLEFGKDVVNGRCLIMRCGNEKCIYVIAPERPFFEVTKELQDLLNGATYIYSLMKTLKYSFGEDLYMFEEARRHGAKVIFDGSAQYMNEEEKTLYELGDGMFLNVQAYERLMEVSGEDPIKKLLKSGAEFVCLTDGDKGAKCFYQGGECAVDAMKVDVVDSTGAGDSFAGCFLHCRVNDMPYEKAIRYAAANGAYACTVVGGMGGTTKIEALEKFASSHGFEI